MERKRVLIGTSTAPILAAANKMCSHSGLFVSHRAMCSPAWMPQCISPWAARSQSSCSACQLQCRPAYVNASRVPKRSAARSSISPIVTFSNQSPIRHSFVSWCVDVALSPSRCSRTPGLSCGRKRERSGRWRQSAPGPCSAWSTLTPHSTLAPVRLFDLDAIAHHPQLHLLQTHFPTLFELSHPSAIPGTGGDIHDDSHQVVPVENSTVTPVPFHSLGLVTGRSEMLDDFEHRLSNPFSRDVTSIIEPEG